MRSVILFFIVLFLSACSPKYKVVKEYVAPMDSEALAVAKAVCAQKRESCKAKCQTAFQSCQPKAWKIAQKRYDEKMKLYVKELESYTGALRRAQFERDFYYMSGFYDDFCFASPYHHYRGCGYRPFWYDPYPLYIGRPPQKPSLEVERLKAESEMCKLDCGCESLYDECFVAHGGVIKTKKVCIENCP